MYSLNELKKGIGLSLYERAKLLIPGGTQLLSKRPEMFAPDIWPSYYSKAKGCNVWDLMVANIWTCRSWQLEPAFSAMPMRR